MKKSGVLPGLQFCSYTLLSVTRWGFCVSMSAKCLHTEKSHFYLVKRYMREEEEGKEDELLAEEKEILTVGKKKKPQM